MFTTLIILCTATYSQSLMQDEITPIDIARNCAHPKAFKVLTKLKYGSFTPRVWNRNGIRNSSSYAGVSSHRSESVSSFASRFSTNSDFNRYTHSNNTCSIPMMLTKVKYFCVAMWWILCFITVVLDDNFLSGVKSVCGAWAQCLSTSLSMWQMMNSYQ